jgi:hypothetical protein
MVGLTMVSSSCKDHEMTAAYPKDPKSMGAPIEPA